jgi:YesN/AraC family two-component response regulator
LIQEVVSTTLTGKEYESLLTDLENTFKVHFSDSMESVQSNLIKLVSELYADDDKIMLKEDKNKSLSDIYKNIINARSIPGAIVCVRQVCESIRDNLAISSQNKTDKLVNDIKDIIQNEYMENITLNYLAKRVYLSANYIRIIFKENTGKSVLDQLIVSVKLL